MSLIGCGKCDDDPALCAWHQQCQYPDEPPVKRAEIEMACGEKLDLIGAKFQLFRFRVVTLNNAWLEDDHSFRGRVLNAFERAGLIL